MNAIDAILILGSALGPDGTPSDDMIRRVDCAAACWHATHAPRVIPCGGLMPGQRRTEAEVMLELLMERGVPADVIHLENRSRITLENIHNAAEMLEQGQQAALVTSDYHLERALQDCRRAGLNAIGVGAPTPEGPYRDQRFAEEKRIIADMEEQRKKGLNDQEIMGQIVDAIEKKREHR